MQYRIYNAGLQIETSLSFSLTQEKGDHTIGHHIVKLPNRGWITEDTELDLPNGSTLRVEFPWDIVRRYGERGVVIVLGKKDKERMFGAGEVPEHVPYAETEEQAIEKAEELWTGFTRKLAQEHIDNSLQARANGGTLRKATGIVAFALKMHNIVDPADEMLARMNAGGTDEATKKELAEVKKQLAGLSQLAALVPLLSHPSVQKALQDAASASAPAAPVAEPSPAAGGEPPVPAPRPVSRRQSPKQPA